jgi:hypothetical protein
MSVSFAVAACAFVAVLAGLVAWIDRWRESRLTVVRSLETSRAPVAAVPSIPAPRKRAA